MGGQPKGLSREQHMAGKAIGTFVALAESSL